MLTRRSLATLALVLLALLAPDLASAVATGSCSVVDSAKVTYRGPIGFSASPTLIPGFPAELSVPTGICDANSTAPDFRFGGSDLGVDNVALAFIFTPEVGIANAAVLSPDCAAIDTSVCSAMGMPVDCITAGASDIQFLEGEPFPGTGLPDPPNRRILRYVFPDTTPFLNVCIGGPSDGNFCRDAAADCGGSACGQVCVGGTQHGAVCSSDGDCNLGRCGMPFTGPVAVAAVLQTPGRTDPIPCDLAGRSCAAAAPDGGKIACIDDIFRFDGTCRNDETERDTDAFNMNAQPPPLNISQVCSLETDPSRNKCVNGENVGAACTNDADCPNGVCGVCRVPNNVSPLVPVAQDKAGRLSAVQSAENQLVIVDDESFPWLAQGGTAFQGVKLQPVDGVARDVNYSLLNPIFFGIEDPTRPGISVVTIDAAFSLSQSTRFACAEDPSIGCTKSGPSCTCNQDSLAPLPSPLPGFGGGVGPALLNVPLESPGGPPVAQLLSTVTVDTLFAARSAGTEDSALAAPISECLAETLPEELTNGDGNQDVLMTLINTRTGRRQLLPDVVARATTRVVDQEPFSLPTHAVEATVAAFLEAEYHACDYGAGNPQACDLDGDGLPFGHALRVFDVTLPGADLSPVTPAGDLIGVQPDLNVNLSAVEVSNGRVFFRAPADIGPRGLSLIATAATEPSVSPDGDFVSYTGLNPPPTSFISDSGYLVEFLGAVPDGSGNTRFDYRITGSGCSAAQNVSHIDIALQSTCGSPFTVVASQPGGTLHPDGDPSSGFGANDPTTEVYKWNAQVACNGSEVVSLTVAGTPELGRDEFALKISTYLETGVIAGPGCNNATAVFVQAPDASVEVASAQSRGNCADAPVPTDGDAGASSISADGLRVAYATTAGDVLGAGTDLNGLSDIYLFDAATCAQQRISVGTAGEANGGSFNPSLSAAGDLLVFESLATNLDGASQTPGTLGVYLHNLTTDTTILIAEGGSPSVSDLEDVAYANGGINVTGVGGLGGGLDPQITANGRFVTFQTLGAPSDVLVIDLDDPSLSAFRAGIARVPRECRVRANDPTFEPLGNLSQPSVSENGRFLFYSYDGSNLVPDGDALSNVYVEDRKTGAIARLGAATDLTPADALVSDPGPSGDGDVVVFQTEATNLDGASAPGPKVFQSTLEIESAGRRSVLGVYDPETGSFLTGFGDVAEYVKVASGAAVFIAPGENVRLYREDCDAGGCTPLVEDLLRVPAFVSADAISISDRFACAVVEEGNPVVAVPACHEIGTPPTSSLDSIAQGAPAACAEASSIQVVDDTVVYTTPAGKLCQAQLGSGVPAQPVLCGGQHCSTTNVVLGPDEVVCFDVPDGAGASAMYVNDVARTEGVAISCESEVVSCPISFCDPRVPFTQEPTRTCKFLAPNPAAIPGPEPSPDDFLVVRCSLGFDNLIVRNAGDGLGNSDPFGLTGSGDGDISRRPACVDPASPLIAQGECPCTASQTALGFVCSDTLGIFLLDSTGDQDGDGIPDPDEICDVSFNPDVQDADADGFPDACDGCVINGQLDPGEQCDPSIAGDPLSAFCSDECELNLPTSFTTASGYTVELVFGPGGSLTTDDGMGNTTFTYQITGKGVDDDSKCFKVRAGSKIFEALPIPTCTNAPLVIVDSAPGGSLLRNGDKSTGFGVKDSTTDVFQWSETVSCDGTSSVALTTAGPQSLAVNAFALKVGKNAEEGLIVGPGCPAP